MSDTATLPPSQSGFLARKRPRLYVLFAPGLRLGPQPAQSLEEGPTLLCRQSSCSDSPLSLPVDQTLSEKHACLHVEADSLQVTLQDLGSKNGTWVGRTRLQPHAAPMPVADCEVMRIGSTCLLLRYEASRSPDAAIASLIGTSLPMRTLRARLHKLAKESAPVLLLGETGTGKELAARALHTLSKRKGEFIALNCGAFPETLLASELFGHVKNAFNNATARDGAFRSADRGTLFLDELGELPLSQQPMLLRALDENKITPVGADAPVTCSARVVAATNRDLQAERLAERFRQDLLARLAQWTVALPPVRARREDILLLLQHFHSEVQAALSAEAAHDLLTHDWPDNVRELRAVAHHLRVDGYSDELSALLHFRSQPSVAVSPSAQNPESPALVARPYRLRKPSREALVALLQKHRGTVAHIARELDCSRRHIRRCIDEEKLNPDDFR